MKNPLVALLFLTITLFLSNCNTNCHDAGKKHYLIGGKIVSVNLSKDSIISIYDLFDKIELIPLDSCANLNGDNNICYVFSGAENLFLFQKSNNPKIYKFDANGRLINVIRQGRRRDEVISPQDIIWNQFINTIDILEGNYKILSFDEKTLEFVRTTNIPAASSIIRRIIPADSTSYIGFCYEKCNRLTMIKNGYILPFNQCYSTSPEWSFWTCFHNGFSPFFFDDGKSCYFESQGMNIYEIDRNSLTIRPIISWDFGDAQFYINDIDSTQNEVFYYKLWKSGNYKYATPFFRICSFNNYILAEIYYKGYATIILNKENNQAFPVKTKEGIPILASPYIINETMYSVVHKSALPKFAKVGTQDSVKSQDTSFYIIKLHIKKNI